MSIIDEALKKASEKKAQQSYPTPSPPFLSLNEPKETKEIKETYPIYPIYPIYIKPEIWQKKKWLFFGGMGGGFLISMVILYIVFGKDLSLQNDIQQKEIVKESAPLFKEVDVARTARTSLPVPIMVERRDFIRLPDLELNGIIEGRGEPVAVIDNHVVGVGDYIKGATVVKINNASVNLVYRDKEFVLRMK